MKSLFVVILVIVSLAAQAQYVGPSSNVGREYGNAKMPWMVSHLGGANKEMLKRATKNSKHSVFGKIICFRKLCRIQSGHRKPLQLMTEKQFERKVERNARKGLYRNTRVSPPQASPALLAPDTVNAAPVAPVRRDSLIVLGAEVLFETGRAALRREHMASLKPIVDYLASNAAVTVAISGHTDNVGGVDYNLGLSKRRADVVAQFLIENGINARRIRTSGMGSEVPIASNETEEGRSKNRRVELLIQHRR